jgi:hypothetical protein
MRHSRIDTRAAPPLGGLATNLTDEKGTYDKAILHLTSSYIFRKRKPLSNTLFETRKKGPIYDKFYADRVHVIIWSHIIYELWMSSGYASTLSFCAVFWSQFFLQTLLHRT